VTSFLLNLTVMCTDTTERSLLDNQIHFPSLPSIRQAITFSGRALDKRFQLFDTHQRGLGGTEFQADQRKSRGSSFLPLTHNSSSFGFNRRTYPGKKVTSIELFFSFI